MNAPDPFEERLRRTPFRQAPASLRREVLRTPTKATAAAPAQRGPNPISAWIESWTWLHRVTWATLGLAWVIILLLNVSALDMTGSAPSQRVQRRISPALAAALREQRALLDNLLEEPPAAALPSEPGPGAQLWWEQGRCGLSLV